MATLGHPNVVPKISAKMLYFCYLRAERGCRGTIAFGMSISWRYPQAGAVPAT